MSTKQAQILEWVRQNGTITLAEATALTGGNIYHNATKHTGATLARMVDRGLLLRVSRGVYATPHTAALLGIGLPTLTVEGTGTFALEP